MKHFGSLVTSGHTPPVSNKTKRKGEQRREYKANPYADAHRAIRGDAPPGYPSLEEMFKARHTDLKAVIDRANAKLAAKPHPLGAVVPRRGDVITEAELLDAIAEARAAGRTAFTAESLAEALAS